MRTRQQLASASNTEFKAMSYVQLCEAEKFWMDRSWLPVAKDKLILIREEMRYKQPLVKA